MRHDPPYGRECGSIQVHGDLKNFTLGKLPIGSEGRELCRSVSDEGLKTIALTNPGAELFANRRVKAKRPCTSVVIHMNHRGGELVFFLDVDFRAPITEKSLAVLLPRRFTVSLGIVIHDVLVGEAIIHDGELEQLEIGVLVLVWVIVSHCGLGFLVEGRFRPVRRVTVDLRAIHLTVFEVFSGLLEFLRDVFKSFHHIGQSLDSFLCLPGIEF